MCAGRVLCEISAPSSQFYCKDKTTLKNSLINCHMCLFYI